MSLFRDFKEEGRVWYFIIMTIFITFGESIETFGIYHMIRCIYSYIYILLSKLRVVIIGNR